MGKATVRPIRRIEEGAPDPDPKVVQENMAAQGEDRFVVLENSVITDAFGVWDDEFEMWTANPYYSLGDATELKRRAKTRD